MNSIFLLHNLYRSTPTARYQSKIWVSLRLFILFVYYFNFYYIVPINYRALDCPLTTKRQNYLSKLFFLFHYFLCVEIKMKRENDECEQDQGSQQSDNNTPSAKKRRNNSEDEEVRLLIPSKVKKFILYNHFLI